jgi:hypothetical protein
VTSEHLITHCDGFFILVDALQIFSIELTRGYGSNEFREDLKKLYRWVNRSTTERIRPGIRHR